MIPNIVPPFEDELLYSYILRLAEINGFDDLSLFVKYYVNDQCGLIRPSIKYYSEEPLNGLIKYLRPILNPDGTETDFLSFYLDHSMVPFFHSYIPPSIARTKTIQQFYTTTTYYYSSRRYLFRNRPQLYFCPVCMEEDRKNHGSHYIHRIHQNPYAHICPIHHCELMYYAGVPGEELSQEPVLLKTGLLRNEYSEPYTKMCVELLDYNRALVCQFDQTELPNGSGMRDRYEAFENQLNEQWVKPLIKSIYEDTIARTKTDRRILRLLFRYILNDENISKTMMPKESEKLFIQDLIRRIMNT